MSNLVEIKAVERVRFMGCLCNLQEPCRARRREVPESVSEAVGLAVKSVDDAVVPSSPGRGSIVNPRTDEWTG